MDAMWPLTGQSFYAMPLRYLAYSASVSSALKSTRLYVDRNVRALTMLTYIFMASHIGFRVYDLNQQGADVVAMILGGFRVFFFHVIASIIIPVLLIFNMVELVQNLWQYVDDSLPQGIVKEFLPALICLITLGAVGMFIDDGLNYLFDMIPGL